MRNKYLLTLVMFGGILVLLGIVSGLTDFNFWSIPFIRIDLVPVAISFLGVLLLVMGVIAVISEKYKTEAHKIMENDERQVAINQKAKSKSFDLMVVALSLSLLTLAMLGYMNVVSLFSLVGIYLICVVYFLYNLVKMEKEM